MLPGGRLGNRRLRPHTAAVRRIAHAILALVLLVGALVLYRCDLVRPDADGRPLVFAHRGGADVRMANSLFAIDGLLGDLAAGRVSVDGVEMDIGLTADGVPLLAHDPWVDPGCVSDGRRPQEVLLKDTSAATLLADWRCGEVADPEHPAAARPDPPAPLTRLADVLDTVAARPALHLYLDFKVQDGLTQDADQFAEAVGGLWAARTLTNPLHIEVSTAEAVAAVRKHVPSATVWLSYPPYYAGENWTTKTIALGLRTLAGLASPRAAASDAGADGVVVHFRTLDRARHDSLAAHGTGAVVFSVTDSAMLDKYCRYPVTILIAGDPGLGRCSDD